MAGLDLNKKLWRIPQRGMVKASARALLSILMCR